MKILDIELVGFKRMQLNQVASFKMTMSELVQLILGTNGSGKSSLLAELTPLPADPSAYTKEGSKTIRIMHRGHHYVLKSWFSPSQKHSFEKDGEPLNGTEGGTVTVQKELVKQEFGITGDVHELLTGLLKFTQMSPIERRRWFTRLSDTNYDYALAVFQKLKDRLRDTSGFVKTAKRRLVAEQSKVISTAEEEKLTQEVQAISHELNLLQSQRAPVERASVSYAADFEHGAHELERLAHRALQLRPSRPAFVRIDSFEDILAAIDEHRRDIAVQQELINKAMAEHNKIEETIGVLRRTGAEGVASLRTRRMQLLSEGVQVLDRRRLKLTLEEQVNPGMALQALESITMQLTEIFTVLPDNEDRRFSSQLLDVTQQNLRLSKDRRGQLTVQLLQLGGKRQHMQVHKNADQVQCPACAHRWHLGYSEGEEQSLAVKIDELEQQIKQLDEEIGDLELRIKEINDYAELYRSYIRITQGFTVLRPLWSHLADQGYVLRSPKMVPQVIEHFRGDLALEVIAHGLQLQIGEVDSLIRDAEHVGDASLTEQQLKLEEVAFRIEEHTARLNRAQERLSELNTYRLRVLELQELGSKIEQLLASLEKATKDRVEQLRREILNNVIRHLQIQLGRKEETLATVTLQKGIIADLENSIAQMEIQEEAAKLLVQELSPTQGLIAEGLMGFIRTFVAQMNNIIRKVWTYPLVVRDCGQVGEDGAELDYKFPLMVDTPDNVSKDVSESSEGQREIVNLAFMVTAMQFLGLAESPLYLDEFGAHFDEAHRPAASAMIKTLMEQRPFTQLFMISHYEAQHGAHTNAEICVIDASNITVPGEYNRHVVIT